MQKLVQSYNYHNAMQLYALFCGFIFRSFSFNAAIPEPTWGQRRLNAVSAVGEAMKRRKE